jgi:uncharacterized protein (TIGR00730 family)
MPPLCRVCVYAGSSPGARPVYARAARELGALLAGRGIGVVYGGGKVGLMGALADAAMAAGGEVTGVIPRALLEREIGHRGVTSLRVVESMHQRKALMADLADAFVALPGGIGTLEELVEMHTWAQLGLHAKPIGVLDVAGFYRPLAAFLDHAVAERFLRAEHRATLLVEEDPGVLLRRMEAFQPLAAEKWIDRASACPRGRERGSRLRRMRGR